MSRYDKHLVDRTESPQPRLFHPGAPAQPAPGRARRDKAVEVDFTENNISFWGYLHDTYGEADSSVTTVHLLEMTGLISIPDLVVEQIELLPRTTAFELCGLAAEQVPTVEGLSLVRGFSRGVRERLGGKKGCTHMTSLVLELTSTVILYWMAQIRKYLPYTEENRESGRWGAAALQVNPGFVGVCLGWDEDGEMMRRAQKQLIQHLNKEP